MNVVAILGPTASGKSAVAEALAERFGASILSVDSMQVYRGMDIGTAKPPMDVRERISHYMIDVVEPEDDYTVVEYQRASRGVLSDAEKDGCRVVIVGGSGLHFRSIVDPMTFAPTDPEIRRSLEEKPLRELKRALAALDPRSVDLLDMNNPRRVVRAIEVWSITGELPSERLSSRESENVRAYRSLIEHVSIGIDPGERSGSRISERFEEMLNNGLLDEVAEIAPRLGRSASQAVGYKELIGVVNGEVGLSDASSEALRATTALVKRQRTYFRRDPRIEWIPWQGSVSARIEYVFRRVQEVSGWIS